MNNMMRTYLSMILVPRTNDGMLLCDDLVASIHYFGFDNPDTQNALMLEFHKKARMLQNATKRTVVKPK